MTAAPPLVRTSERSDFKRCPWLWEQIWVKGLTSRRVPTWAWFGTAIHKGLEVRYPPGVKRGSVADMLDAFEESAQGQIRNVYTAGGEVDDEEVVDGIQLGKEMLRGYVHEYGKDSEWEVIHSEQSFQIDVPHPTKPGATLAIYCGTWDSLWRHRKTKELWLVDHKTRRSFPQNWSFYGINDQAGSYLWVAPEVLHELGIINKKKDTIEGLIFNALRKHLPDTRPRDSEGRARNTPRKDDYYEALKDVVELNPNRLPAIPVLAGYAREHDVIVLGKVSERQPAALFHREEVYRSQSERVQQARRVQSEVLWMNDVRKGKKPAFKTPTEDCTRCKLFDFCETDENDHKEGKEFAKAVLMKRDPYVDHREAVEAGKVYVVSSK
jgi:hypothetical protein